jgi:hypothetical protein
LRISNFADLCPLYGSFPMDMLLRTQAIFPDICTAGYHCDNLQA